MTSWSLSGAVTVLVLSATVTAPSALAEIRLALKFPPGKTVRQQMMQSTTIAVTPPGEKKAYATQIDQSWVLESTAKKVLDDGAAELHEHFARIAMTLQFPLPLGKRYAVDTAKPKASEEKAETEMQESFGKVIGLDWLITRKPDGEITEVGLSEKLSDLLVDNPQVGNLADTFSDTGLRKLWDQATVTLPDHPVAKGDSWEQTVIITFPTGKLTTNRVCTYAGTVEDGLHKITVKLSAKFAAAKEARQQWELTDNGGDGELFFDGQAGHFVRSKFKQNIVLKEGPEDRRGTQQIQLITTLLPVAEPAGEKK